MSPPYKHLVTSCWVVVLWLVFVILWWLAVLWLTVIAVFQVLVLYAFCAILFHC